VCRGAQLGIHNPLKMAVINALAEAKVSQRIITGSFHPVNCTASPIGSNKLG
jgi:hypothetical protein